MNDTFTTAEISEMLAKIPAPQPYPEWMRICSAVWSVLPMAEGCRILQTWSPETRVGEYATKHKARLQKINIGTLVHLAQQNGWTGAPGRRKHTGKVLVASAPVRTSRNSRPSCLFPTPRLDAEMRSAAAKWAVLKHGGDRKSEEIKSPIGDLKTTATATRDEAAKVGPQIPAGYCPTCWSRWSRALRPGCCCCTGDVKPLPSSIRGITKPSKP